MCNPACLDFVARAVKSVHVEDAAVLEVGSFDVNGSPRSVVEPLEPRSYIGVDIAMGPGVDECLPVGELLGRFGADAFDLVMTTEMLEHVFDWRQAVHNLKAVTRPGGLLLITTRSRGFPKHGYPYDFWRFELQDMERIFLDFEVLMLEADPGEPGVFLLARKPAQPSACDLSSVELHSMLKGRRIRRLGRWEFLLVRLKGFGARKMTILRRRIARRLGSHLSEPVKARLRPFVKSRGGD